MRIGLNIEAVTDSHIMKVNSVILDENCLVIGISVSGQTADIISSLKAVISSASSFPAACCCSVMAGSAASAKASV